MREYIIMHRNIKIGVAKVERQGMVCLISCECDNEAASGYIYMGEKKLGKCVPDLGAFTLVRRIPLRDMVDNPKFQLKTDTGKRKCKLIEQEQVDGLENLLLARIVVEDDILFLVFPDQMSSSSITGQ